MSRLKELRDERAKVHVDFVALANKAGLTPEDRENAKKMEARVEELTGDIDRIVRAEKLAGELRAAGEVTPIADPTKPEGDAKARAEAYRSAYRDWLKNGEFRTQRQRGCKQESRTSLAEAKERLTRPVNSVEELEARDQEAGTQSISYTQGTLGGFFVPAGFVYDIEVATKYFAPLLDGSVVNIFETATGQGLPYPTSNDTNQAWTILGESTQVSDNGTHANYPTVGSPPSANPGNVLAGPVPFNAWKGTTGLVRVSLELLQDSAFNIERYLANAFAIRLGRGYEYYLTLR